LGRGKADVGTWIASYPRPLSNRDIAYDRCGEAATALTLRSPRHTRIHGARAMGVSESVSQGVSR